MIFPSLLAAALAAAFLCLLTGVGLANPKGSNHVLLLSLPMLVMRHAPPACCLVFLLGLLPLGGVSAVQKSAPGDSPPELITKDGGKPRWETVGQLKKFAAKGDPQACFELAERALYGDEVPQDIKQAVVLLEQAAQGGVVDAWFRLGKISHDGLAGARDYGRALDYYTLAARAGVAEAQHNIGAMLVSGRGVKRDLVEGLAWLIVASKSGAVSDAENQVRNRMARRPADIKAAEARAAGLIENLPAAMVIAVRSGSPAPLAAGEPRKVPTPPIITNQVDKPVITAPPIDPLVSVKISSPSVSPPALLPTDKP